MKLIDLLVQELPKRGGWPTKTNDILALRPFMFEHKIEFTATPGGQWFHQGAYCSVSFETYKDALAESKQVAWQPGALPPEGIECEVKSGKDSWTLCRVVHSSSAGVAFIYLEELDGCVSYLGVLDSISAKAAANQFRPIRSEAERSRDECSKMIEDLFYTEGSDGNYLRGAGVYDAIAAGKIPGIKLSD